MSKYYVVDFNDNYDPGSEHETLEEANKIAKEHNETFPGADFRVVSYDWRPCPEADIRVIPYDQWPYPGYYDNHLDGWFEID